MITKSTKHNPNYLCKVVQVNKLRKHPNADRLMVFTVDGNDVITSNQTQEGTICIYFPLECAINTQYLQYNNEFRDKNLNQDPTKVGFFDEKCRVKAVKLRGQKSEGYIAPIDSLAPLVGDKYKELANRIGEEFDTVDGLLLVQKYVVKKQGSSLTNQQTKKVRETKVIDNQFRLHYDTSQLGKNLHKLNPDDIISITWKLHGTSFVSANVLCKRKLSLWEKVARFFGAKIQETAYDNLYASRKVIKNADINKNPAHFYGYDLWKDINQLFKNDLLDGETIYGECVGYTKEGAAIQKGYDYGCKQGENKIYVYRITITTPQGRVIDLPFNMVKERCEQLDVEFVPQIFIGRAEDFHQRKWYYDVDPEDSKAYVRRPVPVEEWREDFLTMLKEKYVYDQDCQFCATKVPAEGIVLRVEGWKAEALKLKSFRFLELETKELDKGETNIEDDQAETDPQE